MIKEFFIVNDMKMYLDTIDSLGLSSSKPFEPFETKIVESLINKGDVVLDIGANIGYYSLLFSKLIGDKGKVYAFEPESDNYNILLNNIEVNHIKNIITFKKGVSNVIGSSILFLCEINKGMHRAYPSILCTDEVSIEMVVLDRLKILENQKIDFIKIDIEGFEYKALQGMKNILHQNKAIKILTEFSPTAMIECGYEPSDYIDFLEVFGFTIYSVKNLEIAIDIEQLKLDLKIISKISKYLLIKYRDKSYSSIPELSEEASREAKALGYDRPLFENFICIRQNT